MAVRIATSKRKTASRTHHYEVGVGLGLARLLVPRVLEQDVVHIGAGVLVQLVVAVEDDDCYFAVAQDAQLVGLLHQAELALGERDLEPATVQSQQLTKAPVVGRALAYLSISFVVDPGYRDLFASHTSSWRLEAKRRNVVEWRTGNE